MLKALFSLVFAALMWVQVPQWQPDWSQCSVDTPDVDCHWYVCLLYTSDAADD